VQFAGSTVRATIDTSSWVSVVLSRQGRFERVYTAFLDGRLTLVTSERLYAETVQVLERPHVIREGAARANARRLVEAIRAHAEFIPISGSLTVCRDTNDDMVIETALLGAVNVLVSDDHDILRDPSVIEFLADADVRVVTVAEFLREIEGDAGD
jgi:putative PIN family toxin of toxin-antitoxin system